MRRALYIDPSAKIGSSFSQEKRETARMRRSTPPSAASLFVPQRQDGGGGGRGRGKRTGVAGGVGKRIISLLSRELRNIRAGLLCENDKSTGKAAKNLDKIPRLALTVRHPRPRVFLKLIRSPRSFELSTIIVHLPRIPPQPAGSAAILNALLPPPARQRAARRNFSASKDNR